MSESGNLFRVSIIASCYMDLRSYPMDKQSCHLKILSYSNNMSLLQLHWATENPVINQNITEAELYLKRLTTDYCNGAYYKGKCYFCHCAINTVVENCSEGIFENYTQYTSTSTVTVGCSRTRLCRKCKLFHYYLFTELTRHASRCFKIKIKLCD